MDCMATRLLDPAALPNGPTVLPQNETTRYFIRQYVTRKIPPAFSRSRFQPQRCERPQTN